MSTPRWREETGGAFVAESHRFRLKVHRTADRQYARFVVLKRQSAGARAIVGSGTTDGIGQAMDAAQTMADRLNAVLERERPVVLVVDDDEAVGDSIAEILHNNGYDVVTARSGEGALRRLERIGRPLLVVTDLHLGWGMDGLELIATIRKLRPDTHILLMSGDRLANNEAKPDSVLEKPFSSKQLLARVGLLSE